MIRRDVNINARNLLVPCIFMVQITFSGNVNAQWVIEDTLLPNGGIFAYINVVDSAVVWTVGSDFSSGENFIAKRSATGGWVGVPTNGIFSNQVLTCIAAKDLHTACVADDGRGGLNGGAHIYRTTNDGQNWIVQVTTGGSYGYFNDIRFSRTNPNYGYVWSDPPDGNGTPLKIYKTSNYGANWIEYSIPIDSNYIGAPSICVTDSSHVWFGLNKNLGSYDYVRILQTSNGGQSFSYSILPAFGYYSLAIEYRNDNLTALSTIYQQQNYFFRTANGGNSWQVFNSNYMLGRSVRIIWVPNTNIWYLAIDEYNPGNKIFKSTNNGYNWLPMTVPLQYGQIAYMDAVIANNKVFAYAIELGGMVLRLVDTVSVIGINNENSEIPRNYILYQNYPNPFNPTTLIKYNIPAQSHVILKIYDARGREVAVLVNKELKPARYEAVWNAKDFPSGVYFYKLTAGDFSETRKMVLMK